MSDRRVLVPLAFLLFGSVPLVGQDGTLPQTLREHARQLGCSEVSGFYDQPGRVDPPYVWGYLDSSIDRFGERSAVYWCDRKAGPERYLLVVWLSDTSLATVQRCPPTVEWRNPPHGLRLLRNERCRSATSSIARTLDGTAPQPRGPRDPSLRATRTMVSPRVSIVTPASGLYSSSTNRSLGGSGNAA